MTTTATRTRTARRPRETKAECLARIQTGHSSNDARVIALVSEALGIDPADVLPRQNVLTYRAWQAKGRQVERGQRSVRIPVLFRDGQTGELVHTTACVFHVSQTKPQGQQDAPQGDGGAPDTPEPAATSPAAQAAPSPSPAVFTGPMRRWEAECRDELGDWSVERIDAPTRKSAKAMLERAGFVVLKLRECPEPGADAPRADPARVYDADGMDDLLAIFG